MTPPLSARVRRLAGRARRRLHRLTGSAPAAPPHPRPERARYAIQLEYEVDPRPRWGYDLPPHPELQRLIGAGDDAYRTQLESFLPLRDDLLRIERTDPGGGEPWWHNGWCQGLDAVALYGFLTATRPSLYLEVGSGNSTKFARRAIRDHDLPTRIVSIDPQPRAEVDALCDEVVRSPLEACDVAVFDRLAPGDILFIDGSHRVFQNSDATVIFTELFPRLPAGVLVHIHDIFLPWDYPDSIADWYFSEQYLLACWLLAGGPWDVVLPNFYISTRGDLHRVLDPLWQAFTWSNTPTNGVGFWMRSRQGPQ